MNTAITTTIILISINKNKPAINYTVTVMKYVMSWSFTFIQPQLTSTSLHFDDPPLTLPYLSLS
jgi:hypothetical protein